MEIFLAKQTLQYKLSRSAFFDCEKCIPNKMQPTTTANSTCSVLFASSYPMQNGMTRPGSIKNCKVITFQAKGLDAGQGLPHRNWARILPTQKLPGTNLATPESFIPIDPTVEKFISNLIIMESH